MGRLGEGRPVFPGIWRYKNGYRVVTKVDGVQKERWYSEHSDPIKLKAIQAAWVVERKEGITAEASDTLAGASVGFLSTFSGRRLVDASNAIGHWLATPLKSHTLTTITPEQISTQLAAWQTQGVANSTRRHRRRELGNLFTWKFGIGGVNPVRAVTRPPKDKRRRRDFPYVVGRLILFQMQPSATKARLRVMLETGMPHVLIARMETRDLHLRSTPPHVYIGPREKGRGVEGREVPLTRRGVAALRDFVRADAFGSFSTSSMRASFLLARDKAKAIWEAREDAAPWPAPANLHPYDLRHAFIARIVREKGIEAASYLAMHSDIRQTQEYDVETAFYDLAVEAVKG